MQRLTKNSGVKYKRPVAIPMGGCPSNKTMLKEKP
nr:MAG TPA: hypothetical protein [Caudoviricetes sp.]